MGPCWGVVQRQHVAGNIEMAVARFPFAIVQLPRALFVRSDHTVFVVDGDDAPDSLPKAPTVTAGVHEDGSLAVSSDEETHSVTSPTRLQQFRHQAHVLDAASQRYGVRVCRLTYVVVNSWSRNPSNFDWGL